MQNDVIQLFLDVIPMPAMAIGDDDLIVAMNEGCISLFGTKSLNRIYISMIRQPSVVEAIEATLQDGINREATYNDVNTAFSVSCRRIKKASQASDSNVILCFEDVTHVAQADQMRRDFVSNVSHELRTPLTAMIGFIETLSGPAKEDTAARERFLPIMLGEAQRMNRLVGGLLSLSRVEVDERVKPKGQICLNDILLEMLDAIRPLAEKADVALKVEIPTKPVMLIGDSDQLRQVFVNLIENAIKYGGSGKRITLRMAVSDRDEALRAPGCRVEVIDYGTGIAAIHIPRLTERFYRIDDHRSRELGGTGLGLAIVKHIVNRHRGVLRIQSVQGQRTTFSVVLPMAETAP